MVMILQYTFQIITQFNTMSYANYASIKQVRREKKIPERRRGGGGHRLNSYQIGKHWMIFCLKNEIKILENGSSFLVADENKCPQFISPQNPFLASFHIVRCSHKSTFLVNSSFVSMVHPF